MNVFPTFVRGETTTAGLIINGHTIHYRIERGGKLLGYASKKGRKWLTVFVDGSAGYLNKTLRRLCWNLGH